MEPRSSRYPVAAGLLSAALLLVYFSARSSTDDEFYRRFWTPSPSAAGTSEEPSLIDDPTLVNKPPLALRTSSGDDKSSWESVDSFYRGMPYQRLRVGLPCSRVSSVGDEDNFILPPNVSLELLVPPRREPKRDGGAIPRSYVIETDVALDYVITHVSPFSVVARASTPVANSSVAQGKGKKSKLPQAQRIRDWNELYWCLKSIYLYGQLCMKNGGKECLLRKIHLVIADKSHVPDWLACRLGSVDESGPEVPPDASFRQFLRSKLNVVEHKDIFRQKRNFSVSYNSNVIELNLHNVPGLSSFYVYFNNDFYLGRTLRLIDFFAPIPPAAPPSDNGHGSGESCDLVPITYYATKIKRSSPQEVAEDGEDKPKKPEEEKKKRNPSLHTMFTKFNRALLLQLAPLVKGQERQNITLKYAHLPTVFDKISLEWLLSRDVLAPLREDTERRPIRRGSKDLWVPYLYINIHYLAYNCPDCERGIVNAPHQKDLYRFVQLRDETTILKQIRRAIHLKQRHLFMTLNDDIPNAISANAVDPSRLLFNGTVCSLPTAEDFVGRCTRCADMVGCQVPALKDTMDVVEGADYPKFEQLLKEAPIHADVVRIAKGKSPLNGTTKVAVSGRKEGSQYLATRYMQLIHVLYCRQVGEGFSLSA